MANLQLYQLRRQPSMITLCLSRERRWDPRNNRIWSGFDRRLCDSNDLSLLFRQCVLSVCVYDMSVWLYCVGGYVCTVPLSHSMITFIYFCDYYCIYHNNNYYFIVLHETKVPGNGINVLFESRPKGDDRLASRCNLGAASIVYDVAQNALKGRKDKRDSERERESEGWEEWNTFKEYTNNNVQTRYERRSE